MDEPRNFPLVAESQAGPDQDPHQDVGLVSQALAGNPGAFEELARRHDRRVYRVTLAIRMRKSA